MSRPWKGKCKKFSREGKLIFEGEYLNGKINGRVKEFDSAGRSIFEGEYLNGYKWNGIIKGYRENKLVLSAEYLNGKIIKKIMNPNK